MKYRLIAILRDVLAQDAEPIVQTLIECGISELEISLSNPEIGFATLQAIVTIFKGRVRIGVGTVTSIEHVTESLRIGAEFIITPAYDENIVNYCVRNKVEIIPGVFSPADIMNSIKHGITLMKLFPANALPLNYIKSIQGPFPSARFLAVGGVNVNSIKDYLDAGFDGVAPGNDLVKRRATVSDCEAISEKAKYYVEVCNG